MNYQTTPPDSADVVTSALAGYYYACPDLAAVDANLAELLRHLGPGSNWAESRKRKARIDIDRLLDRRLYLQLVSDDDDV
jgi:hypothetical protein